jgi:hypothetical protein
MALSDGPGFDGRPSLPGEVRRENDELSDDSRSTFYVYA